MTSSLGSSSATSRGRDPTSPSAATILRDDTGYRNKTSAFGGVDEYHDAIDLGIKGVITHVGKSIIQVSLASVVMLYVLNQKHLLPKPVGRVVSKLLFWPTFPLNRNVLLRKPWMTEIDDFVVLGGAPLGFMNIPEKLNDEYGVRAVINMCDEYHGPIEKYTQLGIRQLWLPTVDHFEPSLEHLKDAVEFIEEHRALNKRVYVHCRVGHGRSAAVVFAWMMYNNPYADPRLLNQKLCNQRDVRKSLWRQPNIQRFHSWLLQNTGNKKQSLLRKERGSQNHFDGPSNWLSSEEDVQNNDSDAVYDISSDDER